MAHETPDGERYENEGWLTRFMRSRRNEFASVMFAGAGVFLLGATLTYEPLDPSFNTASDMAPRNAFGAAGAAASDLALQWLGWASAAFAIMMIAWGVIVFARGPVRRGPKIVMIRVIAAAMSVAGLAVAAASLPVPATWPFAVGLGGAVGDIMHSGLAAWFLWLGDGPAGVAAGLIALVIALLGLFAGYGVTPADITDAVVTGQRAADRVRRTARLLTDRYIAGLDDEVVRLEPMPGHAALEDHRTPEPEEPRRSVWDRLLPPPTETTARTVDPASRYAEPVATAPAPTAAPAAAPASLRDTLGGRRDDGGFRLPPLDLLTRAPARHTDIDEDTLLERSEELETVLLDFGVKGSVVNARPGPVVTLFEFEPAPGVKSARVIGLADDIARSMSAVSARVAVVPGRNVIGIELPNKRRETVYLRAQFESDAYSGANANLPLALGETIGGERFVADLARMPHLLIAGTTGSGKSVGVNAMILSLMFRLPPERCRFLMIDPKMLELSVYDGCPHLISPVVTDPKKAVTALKWTVREMEDRYRKMSTLGVRNIAGFNRRVEDARRSGAPLERTLQTGYDPDTGKPIFEKTVIDAEPMPYLVVVIDEMADLMLCAGKDIEAAVQRLAQMARAAGIHLITATQRPSVDVITGTIKANFPTRISFQVTSKIDSRTILGEQGAEQLLGMGDLLYMAAGGRIRRLHGPFVSDEEVEEVAAFFKAQGEPEYVDGVTDDVDEEPGDLLDGLSGGSGGEMDELYDEAVAIVTRDRRASTSYLQRRLKIGYNRAASLIEQLEAEGVISAANHAGKREILAPAPPPPPTMSSPNA